MTATDRGEPAARELRRLLLVRRLVWGFMAAGVAVILVALAPPSQRAAPLLLGFGLGLVFAAMVLSGTLLRCPKCRASLRGGLGRVCPDCGSELIRVPPT